MDYVFSKEELQEFNHIIDEIYENDDFTQCLNSFLTNIKSLVFYEKGDIYIYKYDNGKILYDCYISLGYGKELDFYKDYFCGMDDVLPLISVTHPVVFRSSDIFLSSERKKTDYYKKHLNPAKMHHSIEGNLYVEENGFIVGIGLHRSNEYDDFSQKELDIIKLMRTHLSRISKKFCNTKLHTLPDTIIDYDLTEFNEIGIWMWNGYGKLVKSSYNERGFDCAHKEELNGIIFSICNNLKNNLEHASSDDLQSNQLHSKIIFGHKSYYVSVSFKAADSMEESMFVAVLYDYISILNNLVQSMRTQYHFTDREYEVLVCMIEGMSNQKICDSLFISMPTVKKHMTSIYKKLGIEGRHQLINSILMNHNSNSPA